MMILSLIYKNGRIRVVQGVVEVCSRPNLRDDGFTLIISLEGWDEPNKVPVDELDRWSLVSEMGAPILHIETKEPENA